MEWIKQPTCVASDCSNLIRALDKKEVARSSWEGILSEVQATCSLLPAYNFRHIRREANQVAHSLAQLAIRQQQCVVMRLNAPTCDQALVESEAPGRGDTATSCYSEML
jgi:hypothetical protein